MLRASLFVVALLGLASCEEVAPNSASREQAPMVFADSNDGKNRSFSIHISVPGPIYSIFVRNADKGNWSADLLEQSSVRRGYSQNVNIDDGSGACRYDVGLVNGSFRVGEQIRERDISVFKNLNVCDIEVWRLAMRRAHFGHGVTRVMGSDTFIDVN